MRASADAGARIIDVIIYSVGACSALGSFETRARTLNIELGRLLYSSIMMLRLILGQRALVICLAKSLHTFNSNVLLH